ncbi:MAG TPA: hypothetical protein VMG12_13070 [Polyangiaceae bacterium]|nr:hypothetical protein [Polyangiaceae bacterium]
MNEPRLCGRLLTRLFRNGQASENTDIIGLARSCDADVLSVLRAMAALERAGLADARRLRLTLSGLALAAAFSEPERSASPRRERRSGRSLPSARRAA